MNNEYVIINKTECLKKIEELEKELTHYNEWYKKSRENYDRDKKFWGQADDGEMKVASDAASTTAQEITILKQILSQSTPLITKQLIHTNNYFLVVDDSGIKEGDLCIDMNGIIFKHENHFPVSIGQRKITHHLPLNNAPILEAKLLTPAAEYTKDDMEAAVCFGMTLERLKDDKHKLSDTEEFNGFLDSLKNKTLYANRD